MEWLKEITLVEQLLDKLFSLISPDLHQAASQALDKVTWDANLPLGSNCWPQSKMVKMAQTWPTAATGVSVIANRASVCHTDNKGQKDWYDILLTAGRYEECWFCLPDLDLRLEYLPGTVVALNGRILKHKVVKWEGGDRVCYAHWFRRAVIRNLLTEEELPSLPSWVTQSRYIELMNIL